MKTTTKLLIYIAIVALLNTSLLTLLIVIKGGGVLIFTFSLIELILILLMRLQLSSPLEDVQERRWSMEEHQRIGRQKRDSSINKFTL